MLSLRNRALLSGLGTALISVTMGSVLLYSHVDQRVQARFDETLTDRHTQVVVALSVATQEPDRLADLLFDPSYNAPYSGRYWQVTSADGAIYTSESLFGEVLGEPIGEANSEGVTLWDTAGPEDEGIRSVYQSIEYEDGTTWGITVSESVASLQEESASMRRNLLMVFSMIAVLGLLGSFLLMYLVLLPLQKLKQDVSKRWDEEDILTPEDYPEEVAPLVSDINELLSRNRDIVSGARRQAADLAHALKTPSAIMRNELVALSEKSVDTSSAMEALERIDMQLGRSLARMRASNSAELTHMRTDLHNSIERFARLFTTMAARDGKRFEAKNTPKLWVRMDTQDIEEVIGNLLDNALKFCRSTVRLSTAKTDTSITLMVEDDGPGIAEESQREALRSGGRLDTSKPGTGLGLAIAVDLLKAYGANLLLERSETLGGLSVKVEIPVQS